MTSGHAAGAARHDDDLPGREDVLADGVVHPWFAGRRAEVDRAARADAAPRDPGHFDHFHHFDRLPGTGGRRARHAADHPDHVDHAPGDPDERYADDRYPDDRYDQLADHAVDDPIGWGAAGPDVPGWHTAVPAPLPAPPPDPAPARVVARADGGARPDGRARSDGPVPVRAAPDPGPPPAARRASRRGAHRLVPRSRPGDDERLRSGAELVDLLTTDGLVRPRPPRPESGWRRALWELSGGRMNPGVGAASQDRAELVHRIRTPLRGSHRIAVISVKGGVGKTTVSACLGLTFAGLRADRVLAMDANPDMGTLADRLTGDTDVTVQHLLDHLGAVDAASINDIEQFVSAVGRLHVLAGGQEPCDGQAFTRDEYEEAVAALSDCYNVLITDSGTGVNHSAMEGTIAAADGVVIVGAPTVDAASRASMTLEWLENIGRGELAHNAVVALSLDRTSRDVDRRVVVEHFAPRCRAVVEVPSDPHLATGGRIDLAACRQPTRDAFLVLAAELADAFPAYEW